MTGAMATERLLNIGMKLVQQHFGLSVEDLHTEKMESSTER